MSAAEDEPFEDTNRDVVLVKAERRPAMPHPEAQPVAVQNHACPNLSQALSLARDRCKMAAKGSYNAFHKYAYASADEVITTAKEALEGTGLAIIPQVQEMTVLGSGNAALYALNRTIFLSHASGEFIPLSVIGWPVVPERGKPLDKAFATALTNSLSYLLRDLLQMPRGAEVDMDARDDTAAKPAPVKPEAAKAPPPDQRSPVVLRNTLGKLIRDAAKAAEMEADAVYQQLRAAMFHRFPNLPATTSGWEKPELEFALAVIDPASGTLKLVKPAHREPGIDPEDDGIGEPPNLPPADSQIPPRPNQKLPPAFVNSILAMLTDCGTPWAVARSKATEWAGYSLRPETTVAMLSLDEAGRLRGWAEEQKAKTKAA